VATLHGCPFLLFPIFLSTFRVLLFETGLLGFGSAPAFCLFLLVLVYSIKTTALFCSPKPIVMEHLFVKSAFTLTLLCLLFSACQKETAWLSEQASETAVLKANQATVSSGKKERSVLFISNRDGNDEVYSMNLDGSNVTRLTDNNVPDGRAAWSANGQHIAFASGDVGHRDIYVMNANGQGLRNVTNTPDADEDWPEWAPTGNRIIFSSNREGNFEIYTVNMGGGQLTRLTFRPQDDKWPTYSPDGSRIAFQSDMGAAEGRTDVFVMNADGSGVTRLTNTPALDQMPAWSPDGSRIAFMSTRDGNAEIYVMNANGTAQTRLTFSPAVDGRPSWSRTGNGIVFTSARDFALPSTLPKFEIYIMNGDGTNQRRLTNNSVYDDFPYIQ
jgi:Tol biopolymer transport system component